ncbi:MAG: hypothetical protein NZT61_07330 [Deltaproteobacteria bacterium]|nr:hypothetical protein [Deltaproteobacteria bacterium]
MIFSLVLGSLVWFGIFWLSYVLFNRYIFKKFWETYLVRRSLLEDNPKLAKNIEAETSKLLENYNQMRREISEQGSTIIQSYVEDALGRRRQELDRIDQEIKTLVVQSRDKLDKDIKENEGSIQEIAKKSGKTLVDKLLGGSVG